MDIVDAFTFPEHLEDALFLGSNLESEGCDELLTSDNVVEDSLKNMLSDKDPMLGSASTQFCLPVLDSDSNFQLTCATGLDDIMDEDCVKEGGHDTIDEEDLLLPSGKLNLTLGKSVGKSPRKSPCAIAKEPVRSLRQSTVAKRSSNVSAASPKKTVVESTTSPGVEEKDETCLTPIDVIEGKDDGFKMKTEQHIPLRRTIRRTSQTELTVNMPLPFVKDASTNSDEVKKETKVEPKFEVALQEVSEVKTDVFSSSSVALDSQSYSGESKIKIETLVGTQFEHDKKENIDNINVVEHETLVNLAAQRNLLGGEVDDKMNEIIKSLKESRSCEQTEPHERAFENLDERQQGIALLSSSVGEDISGSPWFETSLDSVVIKDCKMEALDKVKPEGIVSFHVNCLESGVTNTVDVNKKCIPDKVVTGLLENTTAEGIISWKALPGKGGGRAKRPTKSNIQSSSVRIKASNGIKKSRARSTKTVVMPPQNQVTCVQEQCLSTSKCMPDTKNQKVHVKVVQPVRKRGKEQLLANEPSSQPSLNPRKVKKAKTSKDLKIQSTTAGNKVAEKKSPSVFKKAQQTQAKKPLTHILDGELKSRQSGQNEGSNPVSVHVHTYSEPEQPVHSNQRATPKQLEAPLKTSDHSKEEAELKDHVTVEHLKEDERLKLKKGLQPRQRRSSKSISLDEPPLFIPDNIAPIKKDGAEHSLQSDSKIVSLHGKQCAVCKKNHIHRFMVGCGRCDDWFHGDCVGLSLMQAQKLSENGKEYICLKCSADSEKKTEHFDHSTLDNRDKTDTLVEKSMEEKCVLSKGALSSVHSGEKSRHMEHHVKPKAKTLNKNCGDSISSSEGKELESKKMHSTPVRKIPQTPLAPRLASEEKNDKIQKKPHPVVSHSEDRTPKSGTLEKQEVKKKTDKRVQSSNAHPTTPPVPKPSVDQIRQSVRQTLNDILLKRLSESHSKIPEERAGKVAAKIEKELFSFYRDIDAKYKSKYRSLTFNLRDPKNNVLFKRVLKGDISADHLIRMSPEELASKELAAWRQRENRHTIEMIEKEERNIERRPITKITHKGEIEIETDSSLKVAEAMEPEESTAPAKPVEKVEETPKEKDAEPKSTSDTTTQHKNHLFDLNCKICTGRMAPPAEPLSPKKVQVAAGVARKHSDNEGESTEEDVVSALSTAATILATDSLEAEKPESPKVIVSSPIRPKKLVPVEDEATFLARLSYIWKGFVNMPSVARFVIKAYPVSGALDYLTEDLPDSIQVGGRISPQTVWDYVEKIKASGTKETCLIRFCPATEEDQISYTLLFAYFSSRRRYGVVANNMRQVKDMYLIPLGASEKIPRFLVPFDGPGLESRRPNLLLALIIRQRLKRSLSISLDDEALGLTPDVTPEKRAKNEISNKDEVELEDDEDENDFFNSFTAVLHKGRNRSQDLDDDDDDDDDDDEVDDNDGDDDKDEPEKTVEPASVTGKSEPLKPLRFLPGVLVGWENQSSALDLANKPLPVDDILQSLLGDSENIFESEMALDETSKLIEEKMTDELTNNCVSETKVRRDSGIKTGIKKSQNYPSVKKAMDSPVVKSLYATRTLKGLSLKGKPPDVSTEAFLANLSAAQSHCEGITASKERHAHCTLDEPKDALHEPELNTESCFSGDVNDNLAPADGTGNSPRTKKFLFVKRDPRQAAVQKSPFSSSYSKATDCNKNQESQPVIEQEHMDISVNASKCNENKNSSDVKATSFPARLSASQKEGSKYFQGNSSLQNVESLQSFGTRPASAATNLEIVTTVSSCSGSAAGEIYSSVRHPPSLPQNTKPFPSLFHVPAPPNYPMMYGFPPRMPPPLLPPPGYGFPRGVCLRSRSLEPVFQNPMLSWPPGVQPPGHPSNFFGPIPQGISLAPGQPRCLGPPPLFHRDDRLPGRRHSDPWDRQDFFAERRFSRDRDGQHRQRFYSESYHERKNRISDKEFKNEKYRDRDSTRNRHRERDRSQEKESERKGRDETHRDKDGHRVSRSDRSTDRKTHKDSKNVDKHADKSKHEHSCDREREKSKDRNRDVERDRERHPKDKVQGDRLKQKR